MRLSTVEKLKFQAALSCLRYEAELQAMNNFLGLLGPALGSAEPLSLGVAPGDGRSIPLAPTAHILWQRQLDYLGRHLRRRRFNRGALDRNSNWITVPKRWRVPSAQEIQAIAQPESEHEARQMETSPGGAGAPETLGETANGKGESPTPHNSDQAGEDEETSPTPEFTLQHVGGRVGRIVRRWSV